jgi:hypothetical protein
MLQKDNVDDVVVCDKENRYPFISTVLYTQSSFTSKIFQLNKHYNINNIIIFGENYVI